MTLDELRTYVQASRETAQLALRLERQRWPRVPDRDFDAVINALGEISVEEAFAALERLQSENR